jgi:hypothetical protein
VREAHPLLEVADGKTLVEVLTPILPAAQLALMLWWLWRVGPTRLSYTA